MNEKLTAYALNELPPDERAELEAQLQTDPALAAQAAEIKSFCHFLGEHIAPEDETLTSEQRLTLIKTFKTTPAQAVVVRPWRKLMLFSTTALAACLALMLVKNYDVVSNADHEQVLLDHPVVANRSASERVSVVAAKPDAPAKTAPVDALSAANKEVQANPQLAAAPAPDMSKMKQLSDHDAALGKDLNRPIPRIVSAPASPPLMPAAAPAAPADSALRRNEPETSKMLADVSAGKPTLTMGAAVLQPNPGSGTALAADKSILEGPQTLDFKGSGANMPAAQPAPSTIVINSGAITFSGTISSDGSGAGKNQANAKQPLFANEGSMLGNQSLRSDVMKSDAGKLAPIAGSADVNGTGQPTIIGGVAGGFGDRGAMTAGQGNNSLTINSISGLTDGSTITSPTASTLTKSGAGTLTLSGASTYTGGTTISSEPAQLMPGSVLSPANASTYTGTTIINGGTLQVGNPVSGTKLPVDSTATTLSRTAGTTATLGSGVILATSDTPIKDSPAPSMTAAGTLAPLPPSAPIEAEKASAYAITPGDISGYIADNTTATRSRMLNAVSEKWEEKHVPGALTTDASKTTLASGGQLTAIAPTTPAPAPAGTQTYRPIIENPFTYVVQEPLSTFSTDVDTASYANIRRFLNHDQRPPADAVRLEELINYFPYSYEPPAENKPFAVHVDVTEAPWQPLHRLARIALKAREIHEERRAANFVFLLDISGSMSPPERLPLIKQGLRMLVEQLREDDRVAIVTYAGETGVALESTSAANKEKIMNVIEALKSQGSTNGASGIKLAYEQARLHFNKEGVNRVILCTDGDFNVGISSVNELEALIAEEAKSGVFLSVLGVGTDNLKDHTMQTLADRGNGNYHYLDSLSEARKVLVDQMTGTLVTVAKDVKIQVEFNPAQVAAYRLIGYEKRMLTKQDFNNDKKDAGEIGAGHTITALYEIVPASLKYPDGKPLVDDLKYAPKPALAEAPSPVPHAPSPELMTVKLRYKAPDGDKSQLMEQPVTDPGKKLSEAPKDFQFAVSVAGFGMLLRDSQQRGDLNWELVRSLAQKGKGEDPNGHRGEFLQLIDKARSVCEPK